MRHNLRRAVSVLALTSVSLFAPSIAAAISPTPTDTFVFQIPGIGSGTDTEKFYTSSSYRDINLRYTQNPYTTSVKPVRCDNLDDISGYKQVAAKNHSWQVIASNVQDGTCYRLNFAADTTASLEARGYVAD